MGTRALLKTLPERMVKAGIIRDEGGKLNNADRGIEYLNSTGLTLKK